MKTSELTGAALDWAVAKCEYEWVRDGVDDDCPDYSTNWEFGGKIIEREGIHLFQETRGLWCAFIGEDGEDFWADTPLIAAMRCYVASKFGDEFDIPEEIADE